jgi:predicted metalloprotease
MSFNPNAQLDPSQVEDQRGSGRFGGGGGGRGGFPVGRGGPGMVVGGGGLGMLLLVVMLLLGGNPFGGGETFPDTAYQQPAAQSDAPAGQSVADCQTGADANRRDDCRIVGFVNSIQDYWNQEFQRHGQRYSPAPLVLFSGRTQSGCGAASEAQGPFYCPLDRKVYIDLTFFQELQRRFGATGGPFAQGYVVAHEYGHHIQNLVGARDQSGAGAAGPPRGAVRTELQADCLAGVWARHAAQTGYLQHPSDKELADAMDAAAAVGDDRIQRSTQGRVVPESFTHGSSQQRVQWFRNGYTSGTLEGCNTQTGRV